MLGRRERDTSHGSAAWLSPDELRASALVKRAGVPLGIGIVGWPSVVDGQSQFVQIRHSADQHHLVVASSGGGKFVGSLAPMLMDFAHSPSGAVIVVDPKGEALESCGKLMLASSRDRDARPVRWLDPFNVCGTGTSWRLNFLDRLHPENPMIVDDARALADSIIIPSGGEDSSHWDTTAKNLLTALLLYIAVHPDMKNNRTLLSLRDIVGWSYERWLEFVASVEKSPLCGGAIRREANSHLARSERERSSIVSTIARDTQWLDSPQIQAVITSQFAPHPKLRLIGAPANDHEGQQLFDGLQLDPDDVGKGDAMVFVILPDDFTMTHRSWLRLCITAFATSFKRTVPNDPRAPQTRRHICIDEFANLGALSTVERAVAIERGFGIQYHLYVQHVGQLENTYGRNWQTFIANSTVQAFAINDVKTADYFSEKCGVTTVATASSSSSTSSDFMNPLRSNRTDQQGHATSSRRLMTTDEIMTMHPDVQLIFAQNTRPIVAVKNNFRTYPALKIEVSLRAFWRGQEGKITDDAGVHANEDAQSRARDRAVEMFAAGRAIPSVRFQVSAEGERALVTLLGASSQTLAKPNRFAEFIAHAAKGLAKKVAFFAVLALCMIFFWTFVASLIGGGSPSLGLYRGAHMVVLTVMNLALWAMGPFTRLFGDELSIGIGLVAGLLLLSVYSDAIWKYSGMEFLFGVLRSGLRYVALAMFGPRWSIVERWWGSDYTSHYFRACLWLLPVFVGISAIPYVFVDFGSLATNPVSWVIGHGLSGLLAFALIGGSLGLIIDDLRTLRGMLQGEEIPAELLDTKFPKG